MAALAAQGYEPEHASGEIRLRNCPFHALVGEHKEMVCGMNLALVQGVVGGLDLPGVQPVLDPKPGMCCVALRLGAK
jgi:predicted ArsR family transcriptional regulator